MTDAAIINGDFVDLKFLKSRKVCQLVIEVPIEHGPLVVAAFGTPNPAITVPVALARLHPDSVAEKPKGGALARRAGIVCSQPAFATFLGEQWPNSFELVERDPAEFVRRRCSVKSRAELDHSDEASVAFLNLMREFEAWAAHG